MSTVSDHLGQRVIQCCKLSTDASVDAELVTLADLKAGQGGVVRDICGDIEPATARRMVDLGFGPGAQVQVVRRAPLADPVVFRVAGYEMALRRAQARCIQVSTLPLSMLA